MSARSRRDDRDRLFGITWHLGTTGHRCRACELAAPRLEREGKLAPRPLTSEERAAAREKRRAVRLAAYLERMKIAA